MNLDIRLARPDMHHAAGVLAYSGNPAFFQYLDSRPMTSLQEAEAFLADLRQQNESGERDYFMIVDGRTGAAIGTIGFIFLYPPRHRVADLGYGLGQDYWGTGAFQAAARQVLAYGFGELALARIQVTTRADNARAIRGIEKLGFRREAVLRSFYQGEDGRIDGVLLCRLNGEADR